MLSLIFVSRWIAMLKTPRVVFIFGCIALCLGLTHCSHVSREPSSGGTPLSTPYTLPSEAYLGLANKQVGEEHDALTLMAAGRAIYEGQLSEGEHLLSDLNNLPPVLAAEKTILLAKIDSQRDQPQATIRRLSTVKQIAALPVFYQVQYHDLLASAYELTGSPLEALGERILLDKLLPSASERMSNRRVMWLTLNRLPEPELNTLLAEQDSVSELQGWLRLALISKMPYQSDLLAQLRTWQKQYPNHPGDSLLRHAILDGQVAFSPQPKRVALLLPMSGSLSGPGSAVYEGFVAANQQSSQPIQLKVYDTTKGNVRALYQSAIVEGAQFVIGPLSKADVLEIATLEHPVPTLLLNDVEGRVSPGAYTFGLSPSSEAAQVAIKARRQGHRQAFLIAPTGPWGDDILRAFTRQWMARRGQVIEILRYDENTPMTQRLRELLQYSEPGLNVHGKMMGKPVRRQDFDMIFLLAYPSKAREIMPLLRYYYAGNVPVYSTSAVYAGTADSKLDRDLDGIIFCDMPFLFMHDLPNKHWPEQFNAYSRLYAIGMDSQALTQQLNQLLIFPAITAYNSNGLLYLAHGSHISRILAWGQFRQGRVVELSRT